MIKLSNNELEEIVKKATKQGNVKVHKSDIESFGNYMGFLGEYFRLKISANVKGKKESLQFFIKSLPIKDLKQRKMLIDTGIFQKEVKLYSTLIPDLCLLSSNWCPKIFFCRDDIMVMEDLSVEGYSIIPCEQQFTQTHIELALKSLAKFHCASILYEDRKKSIQKEFGKILFETSCDNIPWFHAGLQTIYDIALLKSKYRTTHYDVMKKSLYKKLYQIIEIMENSPYNVYKVLCHRDLWRNNLMFKMDDVSSNCLLLDYQTARYLPITVDVVMAVICIDSRNCQEELYHYFINFYYEQLSHELKKSDINLSVKMTHENFSKSCDFHKTFALVYNVIILMITEIPRTYFINFSDDEFRDFADGNRSKFVLDYMSKNLNYHDCLLEAVENVIRHIYKQP